ncbi:MAG TPA: class I SAM-dependent methyltransferase [Acidimicrobiales bacterium]|nr:class I SAM-dependent methyltransferase [Acidimicrobiales bacterium]
MKPLLRNRLRPTPAPAPPPTDGPWPEASFGDAARQVVDFLAEDGVDMRGKRVADIGCGDGVMDLGVFQQAQPAELVGFDVSPVDVESLRRRAAAEGVATSLPAGLGFEVCGPESLPAGDDTFDVIFSWSAFEHILRPIPVLKEVHRVLRPDGTLMIQLWPFFHSKHGDHLWDWFPDGWAHLVHDPFEVERLVRADPDKGPGWTELLLEAYRTLNRITLEDLHRALLSAGLRVSRLQLLSELTHIPVELAHLPLSLLAVSGVKLLAVPV